MDWQLITQLHHLYEPVLMVLPRILTALIVLPLLPQQAVPVMIRTSIGISLSMVLWPTIEPQVAMGRPFIDWAMLVAKEAFIGMLIGYAMGSLVWAFQTMGSLIDNQAGLSNAQTFDPFGGHEGGPFAPFMAQFAAYLLMAAGGFHVFVSLLCESFVFWPPTSALPTIDAHLLDFGTSHFQSFMQLSVKLAAPAILMLTLAEFALGLINRVVQQFNVFYFSMPIKAVLACLVLALGLANLVDFVRDDVSQWPQRFEGVGQAAGVNQR